MAHPESGQDCLWNLGARKIRLLRRTCCCLPRCRAKGIDVLMDWPPATPRRAFLKFGKNTSLFDSKKAIGRLCRVPWECVSWLQGPPRFVGECTQGFVTPLRCRTTFQCKPCCRDFAQKNPRQLFSPLCSPCVSFCGAIVLLLWKFQHSPEEGSTTSLLQTVRIAQVTSFLGLGTLPPLAGLCKRRKMNNFQPLEGTFMMHARSNTSLALEHAPILFLFLKQPSVLLGLQTRD